ncbi:hypothetical protein HDV02_001042, partial [Globomyces sp. JEL0801]
SNQKQTWTAALGLKNASNPDDPVNVDTLFPIGSDSKLFTAFTVGHLVDQGKLDWKTPFKTYWPTFKLKDPFSENRANLIDMLSHRMGLSRVADILMFKYNSTTDMRTRLANLEPSEEFRTSFKYNNHMFAYAGDLVGKLTDPSTTNPTQSWMKTVRDVVFKPVGLHSALASFNEFIKSPNTALAHGNAEMVLPEDINKWTDVVAPAGAISMNIVDRLKWIDEQGHYHRWKNNLEARNPPATIHTIQCYALFISTYRGETVIKHGGTVLGVASVTFVFSHGGGSVQGAWSITCFFPDRKFGVVSLYTGQEVPQAQFCYDVADRLLFKDSKTLTNTFNSIKKKKEMIIKHQKAAKGNDAFDGRKKGTKPSFVIEQSLGEYVNPVLGSGFLEIASFPNSVFQLDLQISRIPILPFVHFENNKFVTPVDDGTDNSVEVHVERGVIKGFTLRLEGTTDDLKDGLYFEKV